MRIKRKRNSPQRIFHNKRLKTNPNVYSELLAEINNNLKVNSVLLETQSNQLKKIREEIDEIKKYLGIVPVVSGFPPDYNYYA